MKKKGAGLDIVCRNRIFNLLTRARTIEEEKPLLYKMKEQIRQFGYAKSQRVPI